MRGAEGSGDDGKGRSIRTIFIFCLSSCKGIQFATNASQKWEKWPGAEWSGDLQLALKLAVRHAFLRSALTFPVSCFWYVQQIRIHLNCACVCVFVFVLATYSVQKYLFFQQHFRSLFSFFSVSFWVFPRLQRLCAASPRFRFHRSASSFIYVCLPCSSTPELLIAFIVERNEGCFYHHLLAGQRWEWRQMGRVQDYEQSLLKFRDSLRFWETILRCVINAKAVRAHMWCSGWNVGDAGALGAGSAQAEGWRTTADGRKALRERLFHLRGNWGQGANCNNSCNDNTKLDYHKTGICIYI